MSMTLTEYLAIKAHPGMTYDRALARTGKCPYVTAEGCSVYAVRPLVCRLFGTTAVKGYDLTCTFGCRPAMPLSPMQVFDMLHEYEALGRKEDE
jgi:Fe-S-cluster containining protein